jgi:hypothetical protein
LILSGSEDGTVRLMHVGAGSFRIVAAFIHSKPKGLNAETAQAEAQKEEVEEDEEGADAEEILEATMSVER